MGEGPPVSFRALDTVWIQVTGTLCNIACRHCFVSAGPRSASLPVMSRGQVDAALEERSLKSRMMLQVHDELVFEVPDKEVETILSLVREQMEKVHALAVPLLVEIGIGPNWRDLQDL